MYLIMTFEGFPVWKNKTNICNGGENDSDIEFTAEAKSNTLLLSRHSKNIWRENSNKKIQDGTKIHLQLFV